MLFTHTLFPTHITNLFYTIQTETSRRPGDSSLICTARNYPNVLSDHLGQAHHPFAWQPLHLPWIARHMPVSYIFSQALPHNVHRDHTSLYNFSLPPHSPLLHHPPHLFLSPSQYLLLYTLYFFPPTDCSLIISLSSAPYILFSPTGFTPSHPSDSYHFPSPNSLWYSHISLWSLC